MRTKALLLTAALAAAGITTSMAEVYSVNAVGYVNLTLPMGWSLIANPLKAANNNNVLSVIMPVVPEGSTLFKYDAVAQAFPDPSTFAFGAWDVDYALNPGEGAFINMAEAGTITFVGEVPQGTLTTTLAPGWQLVASQVPQAGDMTDALGFTPGEGDTVYQFDGAIQNYLDPRTFAFGGWDVQPNLKVGESAWLLRTEAGAWTRTFSVNP